VHRPKTLQSHARLLDAARILNLFRAANAAATSTEKCLKQHRVSEGVHIEVGEHVEALYDDGFFYGAVIVSVEREEGEEEEGEREGGNAAVVHELEGAHELDGAGDGRHVCGEGRLRIVVAWDDGDKRDTHKTPPQLRPATYRGGGFAGRGGRGGGGAHPRITKPARKTQVKILKKRARYSIG